MILLGKLSKCLACCKYTTLFLSKASSIHKCGGDVNIFSYPTPWPRLLFDTLAIACSSVTSQPAAMISGRAGSSRAVSCPKVIATHDLTVEVMAHGSGWNDAGISGKFANTLPQVVAEDLCQHLDLYYLPWSLKSFLTSENEVIKKNFIVIQHYGNFVVRVIRCKLPVSPVISVLRREAVPIYSA